MRSKARSGHEDAPESYFPMRHAAPRARVCDTGHRNGGRRPPVSGQSMGGTPGPVPNPEAKPHRAESTAGPARGRPGRR